MDLAAVRTSLCEAVSAADPSINCYPLPEPQPEYPAFRLPPITTMTFHATVDGGAQVEWRAQLIVADPDTEDATNRLEALIPVVVDALEAAQSTSIVNVVCSGVDNFRDQTDSLLCDLLITVHV